MRSDRTMISEMEPSYVGLSDIDLVEPNVPMAKIEDGTAFTPLMTPEEVMAETL